MTALAVTLDTNILVYCFQAGDHRQRAAIGLVDLAIGAACPIMLQSLGEFFAATTRKRYLSADAAAVQVRRWADVFPKLVPPSIDAVQQAVLAAAAGRFAYWDALLLATAGGAGCEAVISADMVPGAILAGARIVPAFAAGAISPEALAVLG